MTTRTFSKAYGLAGLRVGWAYASEKVVQILDRVRNQFNVSAPARAAAMAALGDQEHLARTVAYNREKRLWLSERLRGFDLNLSASVANFVFARFPGGVEQCEAANQHLQASGVTVKPGHISGLSDGLRITVGPRESLDQLIWSLERFFGES